MNEENQRQFFELLATLPPLPDPPPPAGKEDWVYRSMGWATLPHWNEIMDIIGSENVSIIVMTSITDKKLNVPVVRGQFHVSPEGIERIKKESAARKAADNPIEG